jgi:hypothetical protein
MGGTISCNQTILLAYKINEREVLNTPHWTNYFNMSMSTGSSKSKLKATSLNE